MHGVIGWRGHLPVLAALATCLLSACATHPGAGHQTVGHQTVGQKTVGQKTAGQGARDAVPLSSAATPAPSVAHAPVTRAPSAAPASSRKTASAPAKTAVAVPPRVASAPSERSPPRTEPSPTALAAPEVPGGTAPGTRRELARREAVTMRLAAGRPTVQASLSPTIADPLGGQTRSARPLSRGIPAAVAHAAVPRTDQNLYDVVPVFWATDRKLPAKAAPAAVARSPVRDTGAMITGSVDKVVLPGPERGNDLTLGRAYVTIPRVAREKGEILRPWQFTFLNVTLYARQEDPNKHFTLGTFEVMDRRTFTQAADRHLAKSDRFKDQAFVFVHGFNTTFEESLYRTAQLAHDMEFDGTAYMYSWPSRGSETAYLYDRDSADRARRFFREFLELVAAETKARKVHVIAHSLGNRPLLEVLRSTSQTPEIAAKLKLDQIVLAAPDIDRDLFVEIARQVKGISRGATLYASSKDRALQLSKTIAGDQARAGDVTGGTPVIVAGVDSIDISAAGNDRWLTVNHATYAEGSHMLSDLKLLLRDGVRPPDRRFAVYQRQSIEGVGSYWRYVRN